MYFSSRKLYDVENNYTTTERKGLSMAYALHTFRHYFLGTPFKIFSRHSVFKYLVNKIMLRGRICHWFLLFHKFEFEVVFKLGKYNGGPNHLSCIEFGESSWCLNDELPDVKLFHIEAVPDQLDEITKFLILGKAPMEYTPTQCHQLVTRSSNYQLIIGQLYNLGVDGILRRCALYHERDPIL